jgi:DNA-binding response OmpR family regulator
MEKKRILIADDEMDILKSLSMRLKSEGFEVLTTADGFATTQVAVREAPDLIILDIGMPAGDGHTVMNRLKNNMRTANIPVIFLTARSSELDMEKAADEGAAGFVTKPFNSQYLMALIHKVLFGSELKPSSNG